MVYGNLNSRSGTGKMITRNPDTGEKDIFGEYVCLYRTFSDELLMLLGEFLCFGVGDDLVENFEEILHPLHVCYTTPA